MHQHRYICQELQCIVGHGRKCEATFDGGRYHSLKTSALLLFTEEKQPHKAKETKQRSNTTEYNRTEQNGLTMFVIIL